MVEKSRGMAARQIDIPAPAGTRSPWTKSSEGLPSPTSPLDRASAPSPRGWRHHLHDAGAVGLGILAALEAQPHPSSSSSSSATPVSIARRAARLEVSELACSGRCATSLCGSARPAAFLACCDMCRRALDGRDVFMYRGERAFCSMECRYHAIVSDECQQEKERMRRAGAFPVNNNRTDELPGSPCSGTGAGGQIFFTTGIVAA